MNERYAPSGYSKTIHLKLEDMLDMGKRLESNAKDIEPLVRQAISDGLDELAIRAEDRIRDVMKKYDLGDSNLYANLEVERIQDGLYITTSGTNVWGQDYAMYVEFGTGLVGKEGIPHPDVTEQGWKYDVNEHGEGGWVYPTTESDPNKNKWQDENGDWVAWTKGQEARPFMYETWLYLMENWESIMSWHINEALEKWGEGLLR